MEPATPAPRWRTAIGHPHSDQIVVRGHDLADLIGKTSFASMIALIWRGRPATPDEEHIIEAILVSIAEHGISPSATVTRYLAACGVGHQVAVGTGVLTFGDIHGGAGEALGEVLVEAIAAAADDDPVEVVARATVDRLRAERRPIPGYGHPHHRDGDPRTPLLTAIVAERGGWGPMLELALAIESILVAELSARLRLNIDGVIAAILSDLGFAPEHSKSIFITGRSVGLAAHAAEERDREPGWRHEPLDTVVYDGPPVGTAS